MKRFWVLPVLFWAGSLAAEETKFYVTRNTFHLGEESYAVFEMDMGSRVSIPQNSFSSGDISVFYAGSEQNTTIVNFQVFRKKLLKFRIKASRQGVFTLPRMSIEVNGKKFVSDPLQIQVLERSKTTRRGGSFFDRFFQFEEEDLPENADLKVIFQTSKKKPGSESRSSVILRCIIGTCANLTSIEIRPIRFSFRISEAKFFPVSP